MRLCFGCNRVTTGDPLFCNHCGRSYDLKLCNRLHPNSRRAEVCSQCGSRELSIPQPNAPWYIKGLLWLATPLPGIILWLGTIAFFLAFVRAMLKDPRVAAPMLALGLIIAILWLLYINLPSGARKGARWIARKAISREGKRRH